MAGIMDLLNNPDLLRQLLSSGSVQDPYATSFAPNAPSAVNRLISPNAGGNTNPADLPPSNRLIPAIPAPGQNMLTGVNVLPSSNVPVQPPQQQDTPAPPITQSRDIPTITTTAGYPQVNPVQAAANPQTAAAVQSPAPKQVQGTQVAAASPSPTFGSRMADFANSDFGNYLGDMFTGWAMGSTPQQSLGYGAMNAAANAKTRGATNDTMKWLASRGVDPQQAKFLASNPTALADYLKTVYTKTGATTYGLTPVFGTTADGKTGMGVVGDDGSFRLLDTKGFQPTGTTRDTNLGTSVVTRDKAGNVISSTPIDNQGKASDTALGTKQGDQIADQPRANAALQTTLSSLDRLDASAADLAGNGYLGRITGVEGMFPNYPGGHAADAQAKLQTLKTQIGFNVLSAIRDSAKTGGGLGAISDKEEEMLQRALAPLDNVQSEDQLKAALGQIREYVVGAKQRLTNAYNQTYNGQPIPVPGGAQPNQSGQTTPKVLKFDAQGNPL